MRNFLAGVILRGVGRGVDQRRLERGGQAVRRERDRARTRRHTFDRPDRRGTRHPYTDPGGALAQLTPPASSQREPYRMNRAPVARSSSGRKKGKAAAKTTFQANPVSQRQSLQPTKPPTGTVDKIDAEAAHENSEAQSQVRPAEAVRDVGSRPGADRHHGRQDDGGADIDVAVTGNTRGRLTDQSAAAEPPGLSPSLCAG